MDFDGTIEGLKIDLMRFSMAWPWRPEDLDAPNLTVTARDDGGVLLNWDNKSEVAEGFEIFRSGVSIGEVTKVSKGLNSFVDTGAEPEKSYTYYVRAYTPIDFMFLGKDVDIGNKYSDPSKEVSGQYTTGTFLSLQASPPEGGNVSFDNITWSNSDSKVVEEDIEVDIYAQEIQGYSFVKWTKDGEVISTQANDT